MVKQKNQMELQMSAALHGLYMSKVTQVSKQKYLILVEMTPPDKEVHVRYKNKQKRGDFF